MTRKIEPDRQTDRRNLAVSFFLQSFRKMDPLFHALFRRALQQYSCLSLPTSTRPTFMEKKKNRKTKKIQHAEHKHTYTHTRGARRDTRGYAERCYIAASRLAGVFSIPRFPPSDLSVCCFGAMGRERRKPPGALSLLTTVR